MRQLPLHAVDLTRGGGPYACLWIGLGFLRARMSPIRAAARVPLSSPSWPGNCLVFNSPENRLSGQPTGAGWPDRSGSGSDDQGAESGGASTPATP